MMAKNMSVGGESMTHEFHDSINWWYLKIS